MTIHTDHRLEAETAIAELNQSSRRTSSLEAGKRVAAALQTILDADASENGD